MKRMPRELTEALREAGAVHVRCGKHHVFRLPNGRKFVIGSTPSEYRAMKNALAGLRRISRLDTPA